MKILIISGFLGAGKTTFIKTMAQRTRRDFVVLENEYGGSGIDTQTLQSDLSPTAPDINIWELTEGCVCCSMKDSFANSILTIANSLDPEYLIVEPTGVAKLGSLIGNLRQIQYENIVLLKPLTILDCHNFESGRKECGDIWLDQLQNAGTIVFSKSESADEDTQGALYTEARSLNAEAQIITNHYSTCPDSWFSDLLEQYLDKDFRPPATETGAEAEPPETMTMQGVALKHPEQLILFLNGVTAGTFGRILRAKGFLKTGEIWLRFDVVGNRYAITGAEAAEESQTVFIGHGLRRDWLRQVLQPAFRFYQPQDKRLKRAPAGRKPLRPRKSP